MAADDIYRVQANFEGPSQAASYGLMYRQEVINSVVNGFGPRVLAVTWLFRLAQVVRDMLSDDWWLASVDCHQVYSEIGEDGIEPPWNEPEAVQVGSRTGPSLPANCTALCGLLQATFSARHNGRIFVPGVAESDTVVGNLTPAFLAGAFSDFRNELIAELAEESGGTGRWVVGVINGNVLDLAPPFKDWSGAFAQATAATVTPIIASQRRRTTKVRGMAL